MKQRILLVEDDPHLAEGLLLNLDLEGYEALHADSAEKAEEIWRKEKCDLILLDVMLPGMDGFSFCRLVRRAGDRIPVLFLTARGAGPDRIRGLDEGGDDYITKPFELQELLARVKSMLRRQDWFRTPSVEPELVIGRAVVDLRAYKARTPEGQVALKEKEAMILRLLSEHEGEAVDRQTILDRVWGFGAYPTTRTVDNFILSLRKLVEDDPRHPRHIQTVHGVGYRMVLSAEDPVTGTGGDTPAS